MTRKSKTGTLRKNNTILRVAILYLGETNTTPARSKTVKESTYSLPPGRAGTRKTLKLMSKIVKKDKKLDAVRTIALNTVSNLAEKNYTAEAAALLEYVQNNVRYVRDIRGVETLHDFEALCQYWQGDCDDKSILLASLLESIGHPARFVAVSFDGRHFTHVLVQTKIGRDWVWCETTEHWPLGKPPPGIKKIMIQDI